MSTHVLIPRPQRVVRGLRSALGSGLVVIGPGASWVGANETAVGITTPDHLTGELVLVDDWPTVTGATYTDADGNLCFIPATNAPEVTGPEYQTEVSAPVLIRTSPVACSTFGAGAADLEALAKAQAVEQFWFGLGRALWGGPISTEAHELSTGTGGNLDAYGLAQALGDAEARLAASPGMAAGRGLVHVPYDLLPRLAAAGLVTKQPGSNRWATAHDNTVVADPGYGLLGTFGTPIEDGDSVIVATPPVVVWVGEPFLSGPSIKPATNDVEYGYIIPAVWGWRTGQSYGAIVHDCTPPVCAAEDAEV